MNKKTISEVMRLMGRKGGKIGGPIGGKIGGKIGGRRSLETMTPEARVERARKAGLASAKARAKKRRA